MPEWLEFHRLLGVERFYMYNNRSTDDHLEVLAPYIDEGTVVWHDWPMFPGQRECYEQCLADHGHETRWMAFIDLDEFLFSPTRRLLSGRADGVRAVSRRGREPHLLRDLGPRGAAARPRRSRPTRSGSTSTSRATGS